MEDEGIEDLVFAIKVVGSLAFAMAAAALGGVIGLVVWLS